VNGKFVRLVDVIGLAVLIRVDMFELCNGRTSMGTEECGSRGIDRRKVEEQQA
jgi:hypothetical protein